jgi:predicted Zn-ribbon and HTH transcriptional regulator
MRNFGKNKCKRCGYEWDQRVPHKPIACPDCQSRKWQIPYSDLPVVRETPEGSK